MKVALEKMMEQLNGESCYLCFCREHPEVEKWTQQVWLDHLEKGSDKKRCQYCLDSNGYLLYVRAFQGHSGGNKVDPSLQDNADIPYN